MCSGCVEEYGGDKVTYPDDDLGLRELILALYEAHPAGGPLHIHLDDMNLEDDYLEEIFPCVSFSGPCDEPEACDARALVILDKLKTFSLAVRSRIVWDVVWDEDL